MVSAANSDNHSVKDAIFYSNGFGTSPMRALEIHNISIQLCFKLSIGTTCIHLLTNNNQQQVVKLVFSSGQFEESILFAHS